MLKKYDYILLTCITYKEVIIMGSTRKRFNVEMDIDPQELKPVFEDKIKKVLADKEARQKANQEKLK